MLHLPLIFILFGFFYGQNGYFGYHDIVWRPVSPQELEMKSPIVEPGADAEAIFWDVRLDDRKSETLSYEHYVRVKIFNERGREKFSKLDIPFSKTKKIENLAARVIKADGSVLNIRPEDIFEREIIRADKIKIKAKSFAFVGVEPGAIVEYQYREIYKDAWGNGVRLIFQRDIPLQQTSYHVRPQKDYKLDFKYYNMPETRFAEDPSDKGFYVATLEKVPAFKVEPNMPPEDEVRRWAYLSYSRTDKFTPPWGAMHLRYHPWVTLYAKPTDPIKKKAAELTANATSDEERLRRIYNFVQKEIKNIDYDDVLTDQEREKLDHDHAEDTLTHGFGNSIYVELLFASLARALGYEVDLIFAGDRSNTFFDPDKYPFSSFLEIAGVSVNVKSQLLFFSASAPFVPFGYMPWNRQGIISMLVSERGYMWRSLSVSEPERSPAKRTARLKLANDGTVEGTVKVEYSGQQAISRRRDTFRLPQNARIDLVADLVKARLPTAEVTAISIENLNDNTKPLIYEYRVRIPGYAQKTGKRLFLQPGVFEYGVKALFSSNTRIHPIHFAYPWSEEDSVEIELPSGYALDNADQPAPISDPNKIGSLKILMNFDKPNNTLRYRRDFYFGKGGGVLFPVEAYRGLKNLFDNFYHADSHIITLRQTD